MASILYPAGYEGKMIVGGRIATASDALIPFRGGVLLTPEFITGASALEERLRNRKPALWRRVLKVIWKVAVKVAVNAIASGLITSVGLVFATRSISMAAVVAGVATASVIGVMYAPEGSWIRKFSSAFLFGAGVSAIIRGIIWFQGINPVSDGLKGLGVIGGIGGSIPGMNR